MAAKWLIPVLAGLLLTGAGDETFDRSAMMFPVIYCVSFTSEDGTVTDCSDTIELAPEASYILTATIQTDFDIGDESHLTTAVPDGYYFQWECDFGTFDEDERTVNDVIWIAPEDEGMIIFSLTLNDGGDLAGSEYRKSFAVWVGEPAVRSDYARDHVLVMVQDWCTEADVADLARYRPCTGEYRLISRSINAYTLDIDPEVEIFDAVREITWWPCIIVAEPDFIVEMMAPGFNEETQSWDIPDPDR